MVYSLGFLPLFFGWFVLVNRVFLPISTMFFTIYADFYCFSIIIVTFAVRTM